MGMAFTDTLVSETDARVVVVDRNHQPGRHWTTAYPFVRLHQPSAFYGVNSLDLGSGHHRPIRLERGALRISDRRGNLRVLRPPHAPATFADRAGQLLPDERIPRRSPLQNAGRSRLHGRRGAAHRRHRLHARHGALDATTALSGFSRHRVRTSERPCQDSPPTSATSSSGPARPASTCACGCWATASRRIG